MFARVSNAVSDVDRLREIDVANESVHDHSAFISRFLATHAYASITSFIAQLNTASTSLTLSQADALPHPPSIPALLALLSCVDALIEAHPPLPTANARFGNPAFRDVLGALHKESRGWVKDMLRSGMDVSALPVVRRGRQQLMDDGDTHETHVHLPSRLPQKVIDSLRARGELPAGIGEHDHSAHDAAHKHAHSHHPDEESKEQDTATSLPPKDLADDERLDRVADVLCLYLDASFGDIRRIDYGTGHELNFVSFLYGLHAIHFISSASLSPPSVSAPPPVPSGAALSVLSSLALVVFPRYLSVMRRLQLQYLLEPAGSRGVWGLDDYSFLPFLLGSAQLIGHPHLRPRSIRYPEVLEAFSAEYVYVQAVRWVMSIKSVSFAEHSPVLNDITAVRSWRAVNDGLTRMYEAEVLRKFPIVQHFIFTDLLSARLVKPITRQCPPVLRSPPVLPCGVMLTFLAVAVRTLCSGGGARAGAVLQ